MLKHFAPLSKMFKRST